MLTSARSETHAERTADDDFASPGYINSDQVGVSVHSHPHDGVCVGYAHRCDGSEHGATKSVGRRQSFSREGGVFVVETHPLEFDGEPYDEILTVELAG